jgi:hypothetical protein
MMTTDKPKTKSQGKVVIEVHDGEWFVMLPDGSVQTSATKAGAEKIAKSWLKTNADDDAVNVGLIEWRL